MFRPVRKRIVRIATIILVVSVILFSYSVYSIESNVSTHNNVTVPSGAASSVSISENGVQAGNDLEYIIASHNGTNINVSAYMLSPSGVHSGILSIVNVNQGSRVFVAGASGNWTLVITNNAHTLATLDVTITNIGSIYLIGAIFGFILLIVGIVMIGLNSYARVAERRREKNRGFSE
ncbi:MAG: hypothetical protein QXN26_02300 [Thermoplasmataceae archaeon]